MSQLIQTYLNIKKRKINEETIKECNECKLKYNVENDEDREIHKQFHSQYLSNFKLPVYKFLFF